MRKNRLKNTTPSVTDRAEKIQASPNYTIQSFPKIKFA